MYRFSALTEIGLDASELYHMSRADQSVLIGQVTNKVLTDQSVGELARLMEWERLTGGQNHDKVKNTEQTYSLSKYFNHSEPIYEVAEKVIPIEGYEDIFIHGDETGFSINDSDGIMIDEYTPREFAEILRNDPNYHGGDIRLCSCCTGAVNAIAAKTLAHQLEVNVLVPTDTLWIHQTGTITIGRDAIINDGHWSLFEGRK